MTHVRNVGILTGALALVVSATVGPAGAAPVPAAPVAGALVAAAPVATVASTARAAEPAADPCPAAFPVDELVRGQQLTGLTVHEGTTPAPFDATVLGVLEGGIAPGLDMILVRTSSPAIDTVGGIWAGMSGSPVYAADGRLVGAVAYGLAVGASPVAGITPANAMLALQDRARAGTSAAPLAGTASARGLAPLPVPLAVSGTGVARLQRFLASSGGTLDTALAYRAGAASTAPAVAATPAPGDNAAAAIAVGDVSAVAVGTTTAVCGDQALLFGHPMNFAGSTTMSYHAADAILVQEDLVTPFKVANPLGAIGTVDQDRLAGLRAILGPVPRGAAIRSTFTVPATGDTRTGTTTAMDPTFVDQVAAVHTYATIDRTLESAGSGTVAFTWTARGTRADGRTWSFTREDALASSFDASFEAGFLVLARLTPLLTATDEDVTITSVRIDGDLAEDVRARTIGQVEVRGVRGWRPLGGPRRLVVQAGSPVVLRVALAGTGGATSRTVRLTLPALDPGFSTVVVQPGAGSFVEEDPGSARVRDLLRAARSDLNGTDLEAVTFGETGDGPTAVAGTDEVVLGFVEGAVQAR
jgi:hypothetical protein